MRSTREYVDDREWPHELRFDTVGPFPEKVWARIDTIGPRKRAAPTGRPFS